MSYCEIARRRITSLWHQFFKGKVNANGVKKDEAPAPKNRDSNQYKNDMQIVSALNRIADEFVANEEQNARSEEKKACREYSMIFLVAVTFAATFALAIYTAGLYHQTKRLANDTSDASTKQLAVMQGQLDEMKLENRAWIGNNLITMKIDVSTHSSHFCYIYFSPGIWDNCPYYNDAD